MKSQFSLVLTAVILLGSVSLLAACNTTAGAGKDITATGDALTSSAKKHSP